MNSLAGLAKAAWRENLGLRLAFVVNLLYLAGALVALPFDHRVILGLNPWIKPIKFDLSILIYMPTIALLLAGLVRRSRLRTVIGWGTAVAMIVENGIISLQSLRGVRSHMNYTSVLNASLFAVMGQFIAFNTVLVLLLLVLYMVQRTVWARPVVWGARLGLLLLLAGSFEGVYMIARYQAHTVGARDGGPGLPFVNWSTGHGDLRIAHFFALHALQALLLLGWAVSHRAWPSRTQVAVVCAGFAAYFAVVWLLFRQAIAGRPLLL